MARVLTEMCVAEGPVTPAELGRRARLKTNQVTALLARLVDARLVRPTGRPDKRSRYYEVVDRLFRIWLALREDPASAGRLRRLTHFYERWFDSHRRETRTGAGRRGPAHGSYPPDAADVRPLLAADAEPTAVLASVVDPWATALRLRDAEDPDAALAGLHPQEREAARLVLEGA